METNKKMAMQVFCTIQVAMALCLSGCNSSDLSDATVTPEDTSVSGLAAGAVGGALSSSSSGGTQAYELPGMKSSMFASVKSALDFIPSATADVACPTFKSTGSDCSTMAGSGMWLSYNDCSFGSSAAVWNGTQAIFMSSGFASCGTFPNPGASGTLIRKIVSAKFSSTPFAATVTTANGLVVTVDDATADLDNFNGDTIAAVGTSGYGSEVSFNSSDARTSVTIAHRLAASGVFDHSITGTVAISETAGASSQTITGSIKVYHNLLQVIGTSTFNSVVHENGCCYPVSGSITTAFTAGSNVSPTVLGSLLVGKSESLTLTGCGTATLTNYKGVTSNVTLNRCF